MTIRIPTPTLLLLVLRTGQVAFAQDLGALARGDIGAPPGQLIEVDGRRLHLYCTGSGSPTVVMEAGASSFAIDWALVQPAVARSNRVCSYDRLGQGWSDSPGGRETAIPATLRALLRAAGERLPFVMVGASRGGLFVRMYRDQYPDEVVGMVLVDPTVEDRLFTLIDGHAVAIALLTAEQLRSTIPPGPAFPVRRRQPQTGEPFDRLPPDLYRTRVLLDQRLIAQLPDSVPRELVERWNENQRALLAELLRRRNERAYPLGDLPLIVLTRGLDTDAERDTAYARLSRLSRNARHTVVEGAGHEIHLYRPAVVVAAINDVVEAAHRRTRVREP